MAFSKKKLMKNTDYTIKDGKVRGKVNAFGLADKMKRQADARKTNKKK